MIVPVRQLLWLVAMLLAIPPVGAQTQPGGGGDPPAVRYQIELLVFRHANPLGTPETALPEPTAPEQTDEAPFDLPATAPEPQAAPATEALAGERPNAATDAVPLTFELVSRDALQLRALAQKLTQLGDYEPLLHVGWIQPGNPQGMAQPFHLTGLDTERRLAGTATFWVARYPHLKLDLELSAGAGGGYYTGATQSYRIQERRRMRRDERHYFDHPQFGAIAIVRHADEPGGPGGEELQPGR